MLPTVPRAPFQTKPVSALQLATPVTKPTVNTASVPGHTPPATATTTTTSAGRLSTTPAIVSAVVPVPVQTVPVRPSFTPPKKPFVPSACRMELARADRVSKSLSGHIVVQHAIFSSLNHATWSHLMQNAVRMTTSVDREANSSIECVGRS